MIISATPEALHYPMARDALLAGKHVFLEKPIAIELHEADELIAIARQEASSSSRSAIRSASTRNSRTSRSCIDRRHARQAGERAGQPPYHAQPRQENHRPHEALAGGDGSDPRSRFRSVVPGAGETGTRVLAGELRRDASSRPAPTCRTTSTSRSRWTAAFRSSSAAAGACRPAIRTSRRPGSS